MTTTPEPDQVAEVLAQHAAESTHGDIWCRCGEGPFVYPEIDGPKHYDHLAAALRAAGLVVEGTEVEEWGVQKRSYPLGEGYRIYGDDEAGARWAAPRVIGSGAYVIRRTRTRYPDRVTEWVAVDEGGNHV